ncbi:hypothetical protein [Chelativorans sp. AA-79]|uniref:hypothetical protein n=1 Tax=Chelativorans sp. AA-79 TaxID=3028735 RepID=UPI0023F8E6A5|nr:hypothetical protein [Chelativorans sp. AA-79]WEX07363.1 hypothetical protein PVE73_14655 [Chelativorans sp. AA-79]
MGAVEPGKRYPLRFKFDDAEAFNAEAVAVSIGGTPFLFANVALQTFTDALIGRHFLHVTFGPQTVTKISLRGSPAAMKELTECQLTDPPEVESAEPLSPPAVVHHPSI